MKEEKKGMRAEGSMEGWHELPFSKAEIKKE